MLVGQDDIEAMRAFILLAEHYASAVNPQPVEEVTEEAPQGGIAEPPAAHPIIADLREAVSRLRSAMESVDNQDFALGVETGMQRAADIIERIVDRHANGG